MSMKKRKEPHTGGKGIKPKESLLFRALAKATMSKIKTNINGEYNTSHHLLEIKEAPSGLIHLRRELAKPQHSDISSAAQLETTFEGSLATIAEKLDIVVDGMYDVEPLCEMLATALENRFNVSSLMPQLRAPGLVSAEIVEKEGEVELNETEITAVTEESTIPEVPKIILDS